MDFEYINISRYILNLQTQISAFLGENIQYQILPQEEPVMVFIDRIQFKRMFFAMCMHALLTIENGSLVASVENQSINGRRAALLNLPAGQYGQLRLIELINESKVPSSSRSIDIQTKQLVAKIVDNHKGRFRLLTDIPNCSEFRILLPGERQQ